MRPEVKNRHCKMFFRKQLIMPTEHGSWSWLLVPFFVGVGATSKFSLPVLLTLIACLSLFFIRQPATIWLRVRRGRARKSDGPLAAGWIFFFTGIAGLCLVALVALDRKALLWLAGPLALLFALYLVAASYGRSGLRSLWMELTGAAALAMTAPAALIAAHGDLSGQEWGLWLIMGIQNVLGALYVRLRIHDTHDQAINRPSIFWSHGLGLAIVAGAGSMEVLPPLSTIPFVAFLIRAAWAVARKRRVENVRRFGFTEMGVEIASGAWIAISYWLA